MNRKKFIGWVVSIVLTLFLWCVPTDFFGIEGLSVVEQRIIAIFVLAACLWISEPIPIWTSSVLVMVLMLLTTSDSMLAFLRPENLDLVTDKSNLVEGSSILFISYKAIMAAFADPTVMLFMGGFVLAIAATKYKFDAALAKVLMKPFGNKPSMVMLGFILITALFSMFMSNTATAAMMLAILTPVLASLKESKGRIGLALAIPVAANVGGMGTPIGTPPNATAVKYLTDNLGQAVSFGGWMMIMVPIVILILFLSWLFLQKFFPFEKGETVNVEIEGSFDKSPKAWIVYITFIVTILLWVTGKFTGVNSFSVALIPFAVFTVCGIFDKNDLKKVDWDVLWLVAGGFALGVGLDKTGLAEHLVSAIPFNTWPVMLVVVGSGLLCIIMSTFMSNSATAALLIPILAAVGTGMTEQLAPLGGAATLLVGIALSASLAMSLPISTPPNALAYAKGFIKTKDMAVVGIFVGIIGMIISYAVLIFASKIGLSVC
ncbi:MAG: SLC13/DASS family transporter [Bacteroidales bacterium]|nr:SLC13/DASS family transporter [Candidatus Colimorpha onthohippi]